MRIRISSTCSRLALERLPSAAKTTGTVKAIAGICWSWRRTSGLETIKMSPGTKFIFLMKPARALWLKVLSIGKLFRGEHGVELLLIAAHDHESLGSVDVDGLRGILGSFAHRFEQQLNQGDFLGGL